MSDPLKTPASLEWVDEAIRRHSNGIFGKLTPAVIWSDRRGDDGELLVPIDPVEHVALINRTSLILLHGHDPGKPKGQVLESATFESENGEKFIVAILGFFAGGEVLDFRGVGLDTKVASQPREILPTLPDSLWIEIASDPREVDATWLEQVVRDAPLPIEHTELSHNAAESSQELIRVGVLFVTLVWNPFVTSIASEAGKDVYAAIRKWVRKLLEGVADLRNPIVDIHAFHGNCQVSFLFRGNDVKQNYAAHDALPDAAAHAALLVAKLKEREMPARLLVYEFDKEAVAWFPSYAVLTDNRIITDNAELIAIEQLPTGLSVGMSRRKSRSPVAR
jgi:hypothetical protein